MSNRNCSPPVARSLRENDEPRWITSSGPATTMAVMRPGPTTSTVPVVEMRSSSSPPPA
jgi:hypothetical protein